MRKIRVIPVLLIHKGLLYKSVRFGHYKYIGDPINAVKIFNEKEVDEIAIIDIDATTNKTPPNINLISEIASEAFMPLSYGGGINTIEQVKDVLHCGVEKVIFNYASKHNLAVIEKTVEQFGSSSTVVSIDVKKKFFGGYSSYVLNGKEDIKLNPIDQAKKMENIGVGEFIVNSIDRDGTMTGYDIKLISDIVSRVSVPVIALGGAGSVADFKDAVYAGASAVAAGSFFVFHGPHRAVLITYPSQKELKTLYEG